MKEFIEKNKNNLSYMKIEIQYKDINLAKAFLGFLNFYAFEFDYLNYGICNVGKGIFFRKSDKKNLKFTNNLCVVNFLEPNSNIAKSLIRYDKVISLFKNILLNFKFMTAEKIQSGILLEVLEKVKKANFH